MTSEGTFRRPFAALLTCGSLLFGCAATLAAQSYSIEPLAAPALAGGHPTALAAADFDRDGRPDLVVAASDGAAHSISILAGTRRGAAEPFGAQLSETAAPAAARWLAAGDFDADGHADVVSAAARGERLHRFRGDGNGTLVAVGAVELPGAVTAWASGEVNRRDGLADLVVAVESPGGPLLLVFEGAGGAFSEPPEVHTLNAPATEIVLAQLDGSPWREIAVAAGSEVVVIEGRDRKLSLSTSARAGVPAARRERLVFGRPVERLAAGDLVDDALGRAELLVTTRGEKESLLQRRVAEPAPVDAGAARADRTSAAATTSGPMRADSRPPGLVPERHTAPLTFRRAAPSAAHPEWLDVSRGRRAGLATHAAPGSDLATGRLAGSNEVVASLPLRLGTDGLPDLVIATRSGLATVVSKASAIFTVNSTDDVDDGTCDGTHCSLREAILAANATADADSVHFAIPGGGPHTIAPGSALPFITQPLTIDGYTQSGAAESTDPTIFDGTIEIVLDGTGTAGATALVFYASAGGSAVRGLSIVDSGFGLWLGSGSVAATGNLIGLLPDGATVGAITGTGVYISSPGNTVGGSAPEDRNVISGPEDFAVWINDAANNVVQGNLIGTDATGTLNLGQTAGSGVLIDGANDNTIGGATAGAGNVIAGSGRSGLCFCNFDDSPPLANGNLAQGNRIGTDAAGTVAFPNGLDGITSEGAGSNTIGGTAAGAGNLLSGNQQMGVFLSYFGYGAADDNLVQGNFIGTDAAGAAALPNYRGVYLQKSASNNVVGGAAAGAGNLVSGNAGSGVVLGGVTGNTIEGNLVGTDATGTLPLGNGSDGIAIYDAATNTVQGNTFRFNLWRGVYVESYYAPATDNLITGNVVRDHGVAGVFVYGDASARNRITGNEIFDNGGLAIDLYPALTVVGPTANDPDDPDTGPNQLQNFPVFDAVPPGTMGLTGSLDSVPGGAFTIELFAVAACDPSGHGEADVLLGSTTANTDGSGDGTFAFALGGAVAEGDLFTATATDALGNTSELSSCRESCIEDKDLPAQTVSGTETVTACETITAGDGGFAVDGSGDLTLRAGTSVALENGFSVAAGGRLEVRIDSWLSTPP